ncbi:hypothetical protein [Sinosporangium siamense]|uniref:Uncharacterized protein n=1 Tax=Sinosporangium siamense TaxID=1367973 RepID=A0A919V528_9ACTN|nr:hypothetical protein [Sinosporangium siamense]GII90376.1 hypothetical protein Ssi02_06070 [Sinosporangium siamense]
MLRRSSLVVLVTVVVLAAAGGVAFWLLSGGEDRPGVYRGEFTTAIYAPISTRAADGKPLSLIEVFGEDTRRLAVAGGRSPLRQGTSAVVDDCGDAVWGEGVEEVLDGCSQMLKAAYTSEDGKTAGEFFIFNMASAEGADLLVKAMHDRAFVRRETGFDASRSSAQARSMGHYVTVSWVGPVGGTGRVDLAAEQVALDRLGQVVQARVVNAA